MSDKVTKRAYKAALNAAMLYAQSAVADIVSGGATIPSPRSVQLLTELTSTHADAIKAVAAEFNTPPK